MKALQWMIETASDMAEETATLASAIVAGNVEGKRKVTVSRSDESVIDENSAVEASYRYTFPSAVFVRVPVFFPLRPITEQVIKAADWNDVPAIDWEYPRGRPEHADADARKAVSDMLRDPEVLTEVIGGFVRGLNTAVSDPSFLRDDIGSLNPDDVDDAFWDRVDNESEYYAEHPYSESHRPPSRLAASLLTTDAKLQDVSAEGDGLFAGIRATIRYTLTPSFVRIVTPSSYDWSEWA